MPSIASAASHLEALLLGAGGLPGMLDLPADADDEAMMELAIALSLQEQAGAQGLSLQGLSLPLPGVQPQGLSVEAGVLSSDASGMVTSSSPGVKMKHLDVSLLRKMQYCEFCYFRTRK